MKETKAPVTRNIKLAPSYVEEECCFVAEKVEQVICFDSIPTIGSLSGLSSDNIVSKLSDSDRAEINSKSKGNPSSDNIMIKMNDSDH